MTSICKPPSRQRYEQRNPVFSVRMPREWHDAVKLYLQKTNRSRYEFMAIALNQITEDYKKAFDQGYDKGTKDGYTNGVQDGTANGIKNGLEEGKKKGYEQGKKDWALWVICYKCDKPINIPPGTEQHEYIRAVMAGKVYHSPSCPS